jgi:hypothetical protein
MTWVMWRQHRNQVYFAAAALGSFAIVLLITGQQMAAQYQSALATCVQTNSCGDLQSTLTLGSPIMFTLVTLTVGAPGLLGVFWGAPLVARELETGTSQFVWMQTVTRRHWLAVKIGCALIAAAVCAGALAAVVTWWSGPENALQQDRFGVNQFAIQGIVPVGYTLFAVALGIAAGALLRRTLPAVAVTIGAFTAVRLLVDNFLRPHYQTPLTVVASLGHPTVGPEGAAWMLSSTVTDPAGKPVQGVPLAQAPPVCRALIGQGGPTRYFACMGDHGFHDIVTYQPANRYWTFQGIETGIFIALAATLVAVTMIVLQRRDA